MLFPRQQVIWYQTSDVYKLDISIKINIFLLIHTHTHTHARARARMHARTHARTHARSSPPVWKSPLGTALFVPAARLQHARTHLYRGHTRHSQRIRIQHLSICLSFSLFLSLPSLSLSLPPVSSHQPPHRFPRDRSLPLSRSLSLSLFLRSSLVRSSSRWPCTAGL